MTTTYYHEHLNIEINVKADEIDSNYKAEVYYSKTGRVICTAIGITENEAVKNAEKFLAEKLHINIRV